MAAAAPVANAAAAAAVARMRAAMLAARAPPAASAESLAAIEETAAALAEIREMQEPDLKRAPRAEGGAAAADEAAQGPTRESDAAHLTWQMRRALLCQRWGVVPLPGQPKNASEDVYCNAICGAALAQGGVDMPFGAHGEPAWQVELLASLSPDGQDAQPREQLIAQRSHFAQLLSFVRGGTLSLVKTACVKAGATSAAAACSSAAMWRPSAGYVTELLAHKAYLREAMGLAEVVPFLRGLPMSLNGRILKPAKSYGSVRPSRPTIARDLYKGFELPPALAGVVAVVTSIRVANGDFVVVLHSVHGAPLFVSNGAKSTVKLAFEGFRKEQAHSAGTKAQLQNFRDGAIINGEGVTPQDIRLSAGLVNHYDPECAAWYAAVCAPANAVRDALVRAGADSVHPGPTGTLGNLRLLAQIVCADIVKRSARDRR